MAAFYTLLSIIFAFVIFIILPGLRVINQYERGIILTFGKYSKTLDPGLKWIFIIAQRLIKVDMRIATMDVPRQEAITKDNVPVGINAVVYFKVERAEDAVLKVENYSYAVSQYALAALRDIIGGVELDTLLTERERIAADIKKVVDTETNVWGIDVTAIKIQDIELPAAMKRAMAAQAETERERRAIIIKAEGEMKAAENLQKAAGLLSSIPGGLSLRTLETIDKLQPDPSKTVIFALPIEILEGFKALLNGKKKE
ncbi:MAG: SPFH domain-containing protein [Candidatus Pacebacteria bacterium]|nr:SPFH domain-containing protein [Candidatus Paceibacterota bacterium]